MKIILNIKTLFLLLSIVIVLLLPGCSQKIQEEEADVFELEKKNIKKIFLCTAGDNDDVLKIDYIWQAETIEDIGCIVDALQKPENIKTSMWSLAKMVFISKDGPAQWIYFCLDRENKEVYGTHWRSRELWDFLMKKGMIGPVKKTSLPPRAGKSGRTSGKMMEGYRDFEKAQQKMGFIVGHLPKVQEEEANIFELENKSIKEIFFCILNDDGVLKAVPYEWRAETSEDISRIVDALQKSEKVKSSTWSIEKTVFIFEDGSVQWIYSTIDHENKEVYGTHWRSKELWDVFMEKGVIGPLRKTRSPQRVRKPESAHPGAMEMMNGDREMKKYKKKKNK